MLSQKTLEVVRSVLKADDEVTPAERNAFLAHLRNGGAPKTNTEDAARPRIYRRSEAARLIGRSLRSIDLMAAQGLLKKVRFKGRKHVGGITAESLDNLIASGSAGN